MTPGGRPAAVPGAALAVGAILTVVGLALAGTAPLPGTNGAERAQSQQIAGGVLVLVGWAALGWGIHRFGRLAE